MRASDEPHAHDCADVLSQLYLFLDHEIDDASGDEIRAHLIDCEPCLERFDLEKMVKDLVARSCCDRAPEPLRDRVLLSIRQVEVTIIEQR